MELQLIAYQVFQLDVEKVVAQVAFFTHSLIQLFDHFIDLFDSAVLFHHCKRNHLQPSLNDKTVIEFHPNPK
jgi:hypothetical protein